MPVVECEKHHLRYDSDRQAGCVICRRESVALRSPESTKVESSAEARGTGLVLPLVAAAGIWTLSALGLMTAHRAVLDLIAAGAASQAAAERAAATAQKVEAEQREQQSLQAQEPAPGAGAYEPVGDGGVDGTQAQAAEPRVEAEQEPAPEEPSAPVADASEPPP